MDFWYWEPITTRWPRDEGTFREHDEARVHVAESLLRENAPPPGWAVSISDGLRENPAFSSILQTLKGVRADNMHLSFSEATRRSAGSIYIRDERRNSNRRMVRWRIVPPPTARFSQFNNVRDPDLPLFVACLSEEVRESLKNVASLPFTSDLPPSTRVILLAEEIQFIKSLAEADLRYFFDEMWHLEDGPV